MTSVNKESQRTPYGQSNERKHSHLGGGGRRINPKKEGRKGKGGPVPKNTKRKHPEGKKCVVGGGGRREERVQRSGARGDQIRVGENRTTRGVTGKGKVGGGGGRGKKRGRKEGAKG